MAKKKINNKGPFGHIYVDGTSDKSTLGGDTGKGSNFDWQKAAGQASGLMGTASTIVKNFVPPDYSNLYIQPRIAANTNFEADSTDEFIANYDKMKMLAPVSRHDVTGGSYAGDVANGIFEVGSAFANTYSTTGNPYIAAGVAAVDVISQLWKSGNINDAVTKYNNFRRYANGRQQMSYNYAGHNLDKRNDSNIRKVYINAEGGPIHIAPSKKGTFTAAATKHGMGVQEFASKVLANKEDYSPAMVKKANFARNASHWHDYGGNMYNKNDLHNLGIKIGQAINNLSNLGEYEFMNRKVHPNGRVEWYYPSDNYTSWGELPVPHTQRRYDDGGYVNASMSPEERNHAHVLTGEGYLNFNTFEDYKNFMNSYAGGGKLLSDDFTNGVTFVNTGGTHESNPNNGVPVGIAPDGEPNLVEEGETIYDNFVYSNRIRVPKATRKKYKLRGPKDMTFADAFKYAQKESEERPNDPISKDGLKSSAQRIAAAQEEVKEAAREKYENLYAHGGHLYEDGDTLDKIIGNRWNRLGNRKYKMELLADLGYIDNPKVITDYSPYKDINVLDTTPLQVALSEAIINNDTSKSKNNKDKKKVISTTENPALVKASKDNLDYEDSTDDIERAYTAVKTAKEMEELADKGIDVDTVAANAARQAALDAKVANSSIASDTLEESSSEGSGSDSGDTNKGKGGKDRKDTTSKLSALRYLPILANAGAVLSDALGFTNKPKYMDVVKAAPQVRYDPVTNLLPRKYIDTRYETNILKQEAAALMDAIRQNAGPNREANMLAAAYQAQTKIGDALRKGELAQHDLDYKIEDFNRGTHKINSAMGLDASKSNAKNFLTTQGMLMQQDEYNDKRALASGMAKSANAKALYESIGGLGKEADAYNWRDMLIRSGAFGTLSEKPASWSNREWNAYLDMVEEANRRKAYGGKIKRKKNKGFTF